MTVPVVWLTFHAESPARGYWDQGLIDRLLDAGGYRTIDALPESGGAIVVVPGGQQGEDHHRLQHALSALPWVLLIVTSDEENIFPWWKIRHPHMLTWAIWPNADIPARPSRWLGAFWRPDCPTILAGIGDVARTYDWSFAGQVMNDRRRACAYMLDRMPNGRTVYTDRFGDGLPFDAYMRLMRRSKVVPCPAGLVTPDTFRVYEALEAGCVPIVDARADNGRTGYWAMLFGEQMPPFPIVHNWGELPATMERVLADWPRLAAECADWWAGYKRRLAVDLDRDVAALSGARR